MEYQQLKNFGQLYTPKASPRVLLSSLTSIPRELGFIGTPKFVARLQSKDRYWKQKQFKTAVERGITHQEFLEGIQYSLAFYTAMIQACGREKALRAYTKLAQKLGLMMLEDFLPSSEDFLRCPDHWEALRQYFLEFFQKNVREGIMKVEVICDSDSELQIHLTDCAWWSLNQEAGYPEIIEITSECDLLFFPKLARELGCEFQRESWICHGDSTCDWHFLRRSNSD